MDVSTLEQACAPWNLTEPTLQAVTTLGAMVTKIFILVTWFRK